MRGDYRPDLGEVPDNEEPQGEPEIVQTQIERQAAIIRDMKGRYHEMASRISFLQSFLERCKPVLEEVARFDTDEQACIGSDAGKLLNDWPSERLFALFNQNAFIERLKLITPQPPKAITWEQGVEILNFIQAECWT